jgi:hypothetical protein
LWSVEGNLIFLPLLFVDKIEFIEKRLKILMNTFYTSYFDNPDDYITTKVELNKIVELAPQLDNLREEFIKDFEAVALTFDGKKVKIKI